MISSASWGCRQHLPRKAGYNAWNGMASPADEVLAAGCFIMAKGGGHLRLTSGDKPASSSAAAQQQQGALWPVPRKTMIGCPEPAS